MEEEIFGPAAQGMVFTLMPVLLLERLVVGLLLRIAPGAAAVGHDDGAGICCARRARSSARRDLLPPRSARYAD